MELDAYDGRPEVPYYNTVAPSMSQLSNIIHIDAAGRICRPAGNATVDAGLWAVD